MGGKLDKHWTGPFIIGKDLQRSKWPTEENGSLDQKLRSNRNVYFRSKWPPTEVFGPYRKHVAKNFQVELQCLIVLQRESRFKVHVGIMEWKKLFGSCQEQVYKQASVATSQYRKHLRNERCRISQLPPSH